MSLKREAEIHFISDAMTGDMIPTFMMTADGISDNHERSCRSIFPSRYCDGIVNDVADRIHSGPEQC